MSANLRIRVLHTLDECRALRVDWARLVQLESGGTLGFDMSATFEWTEALWQGFLDEEPQIVVVAEDDSGVRGLLPCTITRESLGGIPHRKLSFIGSIYELRTGFLVGGDTEVLDGLLEYVRNKLKGWDTFVFRVVDASPSDLALQAVLLRRNLKPEFLRHWITPYIAVSEDPAQVLTGLKSNMRTRLRRRDKKLQSLGKLELRIYDTEASVPAFLDLMLVVEERSWKQDAGTAMTASDRQKKFYGLVTPVTAKHQWFLGAALLLDERPLAFQYGYAFGGVYVGEKTSYDNEFKDYGVGSALTARFLEVLARRGIGAYDLGGEADSNKAQWTDLSYSRHIYILYNNTLRGLLVKVRIWVRKRWQARRQAKTGEQQSTATVEQAE